MDAIYDTFCKLHEVFWNMDWEFLFCSLFHNLVLRYLILLWLLIRLSRLYMRPYRKFCIAQGKMGKVFLQKSALQDLLVQSCFDQGIRTKPHIDIRTYGHSINIDIYFKIMQHQSLQELGTRLQFELNRLLSDDLGIDKKLRIHLFITGFLRSQRLPAPIATESIPTPETPKLPEKS
ncbi:MAG: hypothetical protein LBD40_03360 [Puniceicoccales bacterium]|nr:hypothetical protein [Puniceicoccales bacterium]